jgi:DNA-binding transcriptional ArsR family regulator
MTTIFDVIADSTRRRILDLLRQRPHSVGELVDALDISQPGVSKQLRLLREAGLVYVEQEAQLRWYHLNPEPLKAARQLVGVISKFVVGSLQSTGCLLTNF